MSTAHDPKPFRAFAREFEVSCKAVLRASESLPAEQRDGVNTLVRELWNTFHFEGGVLSDLCAGDDLATSPFERGDVVECIAPDSPDEPSLFSSSQAHVGHQYTVGQVIPAECTSELLPGIVLEEIPCDISNCFAIFRTSRFRLIRRASEEACVREAAASSIIGTTHNETTKEVTGVTLAKLDNRLFGAQVAGEVSR